MAADGGTVEIKYQAKIDQLERDMSGLRAKVSRSGDDAGEGFSRRFTSKLNGLGSRMGGIGATIGKGLMLGIAGAAAGAGALLVSAVSGASDLAETVSKSNTIFGEQGAAMEKWASTAATSMGQSKKGALDAAATFGNLFVQLGTGSGEAAKMSQQMVGLASDFASFHNAAPTDVLEAMTAAFRGEYDAVQRYVPTINAAAVEQQALKMGLAGSTKELTAQHKALATQSLLMSGAGDAMGDFARTSDGLANRQRILTARFTDMRDRLGTALLPVVLTVMSAFMNFGDKAGAAVSGVWAIFAKGDFNGLLARAFGIQEDSAIVGTLFRIREVAISVFSEVRGGILAFVAAFKAADGDITSSGFAGTMERIGFAVRQVVDFVRDNAKPVLIGLAATVALLIGPWFALGAALVFAYTKFEGFREVVNSVVSTVASIISGFVDLVTTLWAQFGDQLTAYAQGAWTAISGVISGALEVIRGIVQVVTSLIHGDWSGAWEGIKNILSGAVKALVSLITGGMEMFNAAMSAGVEIALGVVRGIPGAILSALGNLGSLLYDAGLAVMRGLKDGIVAGLGAVKDFVSGIAGKIVSWKGPLDYDKTILIPAGNAIMDSLVKGLRDHEGRLVDQLQRMTGMVEGVGSGMVTLSHSGDTDGATGSGGSGERPINVGPFYVRENDLPTEIPRRLRGALHLWS